MHASRRVRQLSMQMAPLGKWPADWLPLEGIALPLPKVQPVPAERERQREVQVQAVRIELPDISFS